MPRREKQREKKRRHGETPEEEMLRESRAKEQMLEAWVPKTELGKKVKNGEIASLQEIFEKGFMILEPQIVDSLVKDLETRTMDLKKTARVVSAGRQFSYRATVLIGNRNGIVGVGIASDRERMAAVQKAAGQARLNVISVYRGCGSWECSCGTHHSLPFQVSGRCGSVRMRIKPAPKGLGLVAGEHVKDVFRFAGVRDVWTETTGHTATTLNFVKATMDALAKTNRMKMSDSIQRKLTGMSREG